jgi:hypothetical protein
MPESVRGGATVTRVVQNGREGSEPSPHHLGREQNMTAVEVATVSYTVSADYFARVGADFDSEAVDDAVLAELNRIVPKGVVVHRNGKAFAEPEVAAAARDIDWDGLLKRIDIDQILATHGR